jgi:tryptophan-rich sensory protein
MTTTESPQHGAVASAGVALAAFFVLTVAAASTGYFFRPGDWYGQLNAPVFAPPDRLFGPVWGVLYVLMALSAWLVWRQTGWRSRLIRLWLIQLTLNALWMPLFFGLHWLGLALVELGLLWSAIALCIVRFQPVSNAASWLLVPYLAWVTFAFALNLGYWWLN